MESSALPNGLLDVYGNRINPATAGFISQNYDYVAVTYPTTTREVYTFKSGGVSGITVGTITVNYVDTTKVDISNVYST